MTQAAKIPETLYKYRDFRDNHLSILKTKQVYFAKVASFNDPFDCGIPVRYDLLSEQEFDRLQIQHLYNLSNKPLAPRSRLIPANLKYDDAVLFYFEKTAFILNVNRQQNVD